MHKKMTITGKLKTKCEKINIQLNAITVVQMYSRTSCLTVCPYANTVAL